MPQGKPLTLDIIGFGASGPAIGPVLSEMLKRHGVEASMSLPPDFDDRFQKGQFVGSIYGHGGSDHASRIDTLRLYQGTSIAVPGAHLVNFGRWKNAEFDKIVDEVYVTDPNNVAEADRAVPRGDGDLAAGAAGHPAGAELSTASR